MSQVLKLGLSNLATGDEWFLTFVYMYPHKPLQAALWSDLAHLQPTDGQPWLRMGDLVDVVYIVTY